MFGFSTLPGVAARHMSTAAAQAHVSMTRLSSGTRLTSAADDPTAMSISARMQVRVESTEQADRNVQDGRSVLQVAESGMTSIADLLGAARTVLVQAANGTLSSDQRASMQRDLGRVVREMQDVVERTTFNGKRVLDGSANGMWIQTGADPGDGIKLALPAMDPYSLEVGAVSSDGAWARADVTAHDKDFGRSIKEIDEAIAEVGAARSEIGSTMSSLQRKSRYLGAYGDNLTAASAKMTAVDTAAEMTKLTGAQLRQQVAASMFSRMHTQRDSITRLLLSV